MTHPQAHLEPSSACADPPKPRIIEGFVCTVHLTPERFPEGSRLFQNALEARIRELGLDQATK